MLEFIRSIWYSLTYYLEKKLWRYLCFIIFICILIFLFTYLSFNTPIKDLKDLFIRNHNIGPNTLTAIFSFITILVTIVIARIVNNISKIQHASNVLINFQNKWNDNDERIKRDLINTKAFKEKFISAINLAWNDKFQKKVEKGEIDEIDNIDFKKMIVELKKHRRKIEDENKMAPELKERETKFKDKMKELVDPNMKKYSVRLLVDDLLLAFDFLAVYVTKSRTDIFNDFVKKYGQVLRQYGSLLQAYIITRLLFADKNKENYKIDFMNLMIICRTADPELVRYCIYEIEKKQNKKMYMDIDLTILNKYLPSIVNH